MNRTAILLFLGGAALAVTFGDACRAEVGDCQKTVSNAKPLKLLWLGSSSAKRLSACADVILSSGGDLATTSTYAGGYFRVDYVASDRAGTKTSPNKKRTGIADLVKAINAAEYDFIIVQVSGGIFNNPKWPEHVPGILDDVCREIKKTGATPVIFERWSKEPEEMRRICLVAAKNNNARIALCGSSTAQVWKDKGRVYLLNTLTGDKNHAGPRGNYLWACSVFAALTGQSPEQLKATRVNANKPIPSDDDAKKLSKRNMTSYQHEISAEDLRYLKATAWSSHTKWVLGD